MRGLLYQPEKPWRFGAAFGAAALIHVIAIALASMHPHEKMDGPIIGTDEFLAIDLVDIPANDEPASPPDAVAPPQIPEPAVDSLFAEERPSPPPIPAAE